MWTSFFQNTVVGTPQLEIPVPEGIETVRVDRKSGEPAAGENTILEMFLEDNMPDEEEIKRIEQVEQSVQTGDAVVVTKTKKQKAKEVEQLF